MDNVRCGFLRGTGSAINVSIGWVPEVVIITNLTDGDTFTLAVPKFYGSAFTSGGVATVVNQVKPGNKVKGATSGATGVVSEIITDTGTWAGTDAAGWISFDKSSIVGTFTAGEKLYVIGNAAGSVDDLTLTAALLTWGIDSDTEVAAKTSDATMCIPYVGSAGSAAKGFTVGATISEDAKLLCFVALRSGPGGQGITCLNDGV